MHLKFPPGIQTISFSNPRPSLQKDKGMLSIFSSFHSVWHMRVSSITENEKMLEISKTLGLRGINIFIFLYY